MDYNGPVLKLFYFMTGGRYDFTEVVFSFFAVFVIILLVFPLHECAHGYMAKFLGDDTAERQGRLTLNPLTHIDPIGAVMMLFLPFGYAKPVPVNPMRCRKVKAKTAMGLTAAAGPVSNILVAYIFVIIYKIIAYTVPNEMYAVYLLYAIQYIAVINLYLALFNLLPVPPLDGSKIIFLFLSRRILLRMEQYQGIINMVFMAVFFLTPIIRTPLSMLSSLMMNCLNFLSGYIDLLMG